MDTPPDPTPRPAPPRPAPPRPASPRPKRDFAAEEEAERRLNAARIQMRRGLIPESETAIKAILADRPTDAVAWELLGDIAETRGDWDAAVAAYQSAVTHELGRASAEAKIGKAVLRRAEQQRQKSLGVAYAAADTSLVRRTGGERSSWLVIAGSAICPGLGQIVLGQTVKGAVLVGIFLLGVVLLTLVHGSGRSYFSPAFWVVCVLLAGDWLYAVADASASSSQS
jgi:TM2 domain-containing membrane protein YozV